MSLPSAISSKSDAADYVAYSVSGLIARLRGSQDLLVSEAALDLEKRIRGVLVKDSRLKDTRQKTSSGGLQAKRQEPAPAVAATRFPRAKKSTS